MKMPVYRAIVAATIFVVMTVIACTSAANKSMPVGEAPSPAVSNFTSPANLTWEKEWENVQANARKEGRIVIYGAPGVANVKDSLAQELKKFGLAAEIFIGSGAEHVNRLSSQRRAGIYDVDVYVGGATTLLLDLIPMGYIDPLEPQLLLPEVKDIKYWRASKLPWVDKNKMTLAFAPSATGGVVINTSLVKQDEIVSFKDLLNPKWKGVIVMSDPTLAGTGLSWFTTTEKLMGLDYVKNLILQNPVIIRDYRLQADWLAKGKYPVGIGTGTVVEDFMEAGAPIKRYLLKEGSYISSGAANLAIINRASHPFASKLFINWLLSKEGQTIWSREAQSVSGRVDVPIDHVQTWKIPDPQMKYFLEYTEEAQLEKSRYIELAKELLGAVK